MDDASHATTNVSTIAELEQLVGREDGVSSCWKVDQATIDQFAQANGNNQRVHVDHKPGGPGVRLTSPVLLAAAVDVRQFPVKFLRCVAWALVLYGSSTR